MEAHHDPVLLQVLEELRSIREQNSQFARDTSNGLQSVHARLDAIEQERHHEQARKRNVGLRHEPHECWMPPCQSASDDWADSMIPSSRPGRPVVPPALIGGLSAEDTDLVMSSLANDSICGPGPVAEGEEINPSVAMKKISGISSFDVASSRHGPGRSPSMRSPKNTFFQALLGAEEVVEDPAIKAGLVDDEGNDVHRGSIPPGPVVTRVKRNACVQFFYDIGQFFRDIIRHPIHPNSNLRTRWDLIILLLLVYVCITSPVVVCFDITLEEYGELWWWENAVNIAFVLDIFLNLNTAYYDTEDNLVLSRKQIFTQYASTWMLIDVIAVLPYEYMTPDENKAAEAASLTKGLRLTKFTRILRVLRVIKLLRVLKVPRLLKRLEGAAGYGIIKFLSILGGAILMNHLVACFFYYCAHLRMGDDLEIILADRGIRRSDFNAIRANATGDVDFEDYMLMTQIQMDAWKNTWVFNAGLEDDTPVERYITALYWGMSTLTTVGYGDVTPMNSAEKIASMVAMVVGVTVFAYFMGTTAALITSMNTSDTVRTRKIGEMDQFLRARHVPSYMAEKIRKFYSKAVQHQVLDNTDIIAQLSLPLRTELLLFLYRNTLEKVPFFKGKDPQFITALVAKLRMEYYAEGDIVIHEGDLGNVMYFVVKGNLEARQYIFEPGANDKRTSPESEESQVQTDEETGNANVEIKNRRASLTKSFKKMKRRFVRRTMSKTDAEIKAFLERKPEEFGFYSNVKELKKKFRLVGELHDGEHFGEYSCLLGQHRTSTIVSMDFSELYSLSRDDLMEVYKMWPELYKEFLQLMHQFQQMTGMELTDQEFEDQYGALPSTRGHSDSPHQSEECEIRSGRNLLPSLDEGEQSLHGLNAPPEIDQSIPSYTQKADRRSSVDMQSGEGSSASERERDQMSMKRAAQLISTMQKFDKQLAHNPVVQLLNEGQDLKGVRMSNVE